jgi:hypothetical protein
MGRGAIEALFIPCIAAGIVAGMIGAALRPAWWGWPLIGLASIVAVYGVLLWRERHKQGTGKRTQENLPDK